jgi:ATP-dependent exoDNAse (exonuclease V) beta subunit
MTARRRDGPDAEALDRIANDLGATLFVEAAAGTGKTTVLVERIIAVVRAGLADLDRVVAVTFTEKAAGEMKLRLRAGLERARVEASGSPEPLRLLDRALAHLEVARIGTIHALCADLLREFPVEARVDPLFEVMADDEAARLFEHVFDAWFDGVLEHPPEGVRRMLCRRGGRRGPRERLREAAFQLAERRDFTRPWRRDPTFDREAAIDATIPPLLELAGVARDAEAAGDRYLAEKGLGAIRRFADELVRREDVQGRDLDELEAELSGLSRAPEWRRGIGKGSGKLIARARALREVAREALGATVSRCDADLAACLQRELRPVIDEYEREKARAGKLDFLDLLLRARDLVRGDRAVRVELQARFSRIFVDELQDTDPLQAELLLLLAASDPEET